MQFNEEQKKAAEYDGDKNVLLLAGAGTGKTRTIIGRVIYLINKGINPERLLLLTFTRKASKEMVDRLKESVGEASNLINAMTFHSFCLTAIKLNPTLFGIGNRTIIDADDQQSLMGQAKKDIVGNASSTLYPSPKDLLSYFSYARNVEMEFEEYLKKFHNFPVDKASEISSIFDRYSQLKQKNRYLDFDDILWLFSNTLEQREEVRQAFKNLFDYILVDEMQDTNPIQWTILKQLRDPAKLFCVGDDAQSIYRFRGADFESIHSFEENIPNSIIMKLVVNYRCTQEILDVANAMIKKSPLNYDKELVAYKGNSKGSVVYRKFFNNFQEADFIVNNIKINQANGNMLRDNLVLVRSAYASKTLQTTLTKHKIPFEVIGGINIFQAAHVKDLLAVLRIYTNTHDELAWERYLTMFPKIGKSAVSKYMQSINSYDTFDEVTDFVGRAIESETAFNILNSMKTPTTTFDIINACYSSMVKLLMDRYEDWKNRSSDFDLLLELSQQSDSVKDFLDDYTLDPREANIATKDKVTISTIHAAKGTERKFCFVMQSQPGVLPSSKNMHDDDDLEEERRIMYVALTRAINKMYITRIDMPDNIRSNPNLIKKVDFLNFLFSGIWKPK